jgi:organic radical activating enzyme
MTFFCNLPFTEIQSFGGTSAWPCCAFRGKAFIPLSNYTNDTQLREVKSQLLRGEVPDQCMSCSESEKNTGHSFRLVAESFHPGVTEEIKKQNDPDYFDLRNVTITTSNICNLKCLPCESSSYVRHLELKKLGLTNNIPIVEKNSNLDALLKLDFKRLTMLGGEPFYDVVTFDFLKKLVEQGRSKNISVDLNTNMTSVTDDKMRFLSDNFSSIILKASIDGIGAVNNYLRYPSDWETIEQNLEKINQYPNVDVVVTTALSNLALIKYHEVVRWAADKKLNLFISTVFSPDVLRPNLLPPELHQKLLKIYTELKSQLSGQVWDRTEYCIDSCISICNNNEYNHEKFQEFFSWIKLHDQHRGQSMLDVFPELVDYL